MLLKLKNNELENNRTLESFPCFKRDRNAVLATPSLTTVLGIVIALLFRCPWKHRLKC